VFLDQRYIHLDSRQTIVKAQKLPLLIAQCQKRKKFKMKKYLILLLFLNPAVVKANQITPSWTNGSMNSTTTSTQQVVETQTINVYGGDYSSWTGHNVTATGDINGGQVTFDITTPGDNFQLEVVNRAAGIIETQVINRSIDTTSTTTSLSVFSQ
jgi:hypothetical protein